MLGPTPHRPGGPPIWIGGSVRAARERAARHFDGWFPNAPDPAQFAEQWAALQGMARDAGRDPAGLTGAMYLTLAVEDDAARADARINSYLERYYGQRPDVMRKRQVTYAGPADGAARWLQSYADAGADHLVLRFAGGDHDQQLETLATVRKSLGW